MTQKTIEKAARMVNTGKVTKLRGMGGGFRLWRVESDSGSVYMVTTRGGKGRCSCKRGIHGGQCSHALAALYTSGKLNRGEAVKIEAAQ